MAGTGDWDQPIVYGWHYNSSGGMATGSTTAFTIVGAPNGIKRVDGTAIYREAMTRTVRTGIPEDQDPIALAQLKAALKARDAALPGYSEQAWETDWAARLPALMITRFYASDDPDITPRGWGIDVVERVGTTWQRRYPITLTLAQLNPDPPRLPGLNLADVELPNLGDPYNPPQGWVRGVPGGLAELDDDGRVPLEQLPVEQLGGDGSGGGSGLVSYDQISSLVGYPLAFPPANHTHGTTDAELIGLSERIQDVVGTMVQPGTGVAVTYNDDAGTLTVSLTGGTGGLDAEGIRDTIGDALRGADARITITVNDDLDTITIGTTATVNQTDTYLTNRANHSGTTPINSLPAAARIGWVNYSAGALPAGMSGTELWLVLGAPAGATTVPSWVTPRGIMINSG